jgi:hypothetical protein
MKEPLFSVSVIASLSVFVMELCPYDLSSTRYTCECHLVGFIWLYILKTTLSKSCVLSSVAMNLSGVYTSLNFVSK